MDMASDHSGVQVEEVVLDEGGGDDTDELEVLNQRTVRPVLHDIFKISPVNIRASQIHERGLFAGKVIKVGDFIGEYEGEAVTKAVSDAREVKYKQNGLDCYFMCLGLESAESTSRSSSMLGGNVLVDATVGGNLTRFINHSCSPNCEMDEMLHGSVVIYLISHAAEFLAGKN